MFLVSNAEIQPPTSLSKTYLKQQDSLFRFYLVIEITILHVIKRLKPNTSAGLDCVSNKVEK